MFRIHHSNGYSTKLNGTQIILFFVNTQNGCKIMEILLYFHVNTYIVVLFKYSERRIY